MRKLVTAALLALFAVSLLGCELIAPQREQVVGKLVVDPGPNPNVADLATAEAAAGRYTELARSRPVVDAVIEDLGLDESNESLRSRNSVTASREDLVLTIEVRDEDPEAARVLVLALGDEMIRRVNRELAADALDGSGTLAERISDELQERVNEPLRDLPGRSQPPSIVRHQLAWLDKPAAPEPTEPPD